MIEQSWTLAQKFLKKGFWLYLFSFIIGPIWFVIKQIISNEVSISDFWILYWVISLITLVTAYNDLWLTDSLNYFIPKFITEKRYDKVKTILVYALIAQMSTGISIALFFFFWSDFIAEHYFKTEIASSVLKIFAFFFLWINIFEIIHTFMIVVQNTLYNKLIELIRMLFSLFSVLFIYFSDLSSLVNYSYTWIFWLYIWIIFALVIFIKKYYLLYLQKEKILWDKQLFKTIFKYSVTILVAMQAWVILSQMDMLIITYLLWNADAGYYSIYLSVISIPFMIIWPIFPLLYPMFSEMHSKWEISKINLIKSIFQKNFLVLSISFSILFFVFSEVLINILFWDSFLKSWNILKYSIPFLAFNFLLQMNFYIMASIWKVKERVKIIFIAVIFNFITNLIFINLLWVAGSALATGMWWILIWGLSEYYLWKEYKINFDFKYILVNIVILWSLWIFAYFYLIPLFIWLTRLNALFLFCFISAIYFSIFALVNYTEFRFFILEIKKSREK